MRCSIVMSTKDKENYIDRTLKSIRSQKVPFEYELIIVDDGSNDNTVKICKRYEPEHLVRLNNPRYRNPSIARNVGYKLAKGDIIIAQSDDVIHYSARSIEILCEQLIKGCFVIARVFNYNIQSGRRIQLYTGVEYPRPFFFLGSLWRRDLYAIGGNDEEFVEGGYDDDWFGDCLIYGLGLRVLFTFDVVGHHQDHRKDCSMVGQLHAASKKIYAKKKAEVIAGNGIYQASGGPWSYDS